MEELINVTCDRCERTISVPEGYGMPCSCGGSFWVTECEPNEASPHNLSIGTFPLESESEPGYGCAPTNQLHDYTEHPSQLRADEALFQYRAHQIQKLSYLSNEELKALSEEEINNPEIDV